jgi:hypothetical protein
MRIAEGMQERESMIACRLDFARIARMDDMHAKASRRPSDQPAHGTEARSHSVEN